MLLNPSFFDHIYPIYQHWTSMKKLSIIAISSGILLAACGGGSDSPSSAGDGSKTIIVTPSLGKFSKGTKVVMQKPDGTSVASGTVDSDGNASITTNYTGPVVIEVQGGAGVQYYDEGDDTVKDFATGEKLRAVLPEVKNAGVTPLTDAAVEYLVNQAGGSKLTTGSTAEILASIKDANNKMGTAFGMNDILERPTPIGKGDAPIASVTPANQYAVVLAALAKTAEIKSGSIKHSAAEVAKALAKDLSDGKIDGQVLENGAKKAVSAVLNFTPIDPNKFKQKLEEKHKEAANFFVDNNVRDVIKSLAPEINEDVSQITSRNNQSDISLAKALFSDLRNSLKPMSNVTKTGFLDNPVNRIEADLKATTFANAELLASRMEAAYRSVQTFEDGLAYTAGNTKGFVSGTNPLTGQVALTRENVNFADLFLGNGNSNNFSRNYSSCYLATTSTLQTNEKVFCAFAIPQLRTNTSTTYFGPMSTSGTTTLKYIGYEISRTAADSYAYTAAIYTQTIDNASAHAAGLSAANANGGIASPNFQTYYVNGIYNYIKASAVVSKDTNISPTSGTLTKVTTNGSTTKVTLKGTLPPSSSVTGVDTIDISGEKTTAGTDLFKYALSGSMSSAMTATGSTDRTAKVSLETGSYVIAKEVSGSNAELQEGTLIGTFETRDSKFSGTIVANVPMKDKNGLNPSFTKVVFDGSITDKTTAGAGTFLTGKLAVQQTNFDQFDATKDDSANNPLKGTVGFTGTIKVPEIPELKLVLTATKTGFSTTETAITYTYTDSNKVAKTISASGNSDTANPSNDTATISNQDGITINPKSGDITKNGTKVATLTNGKVNYEDGASETFN